VFGSVARNEARPDSDVDLLVDLEPPVTFDRYMDLKFFLEKCLDRPVDLVTVRSLKPLLRDRVAKEAIYVS
jgi:predicted nucleotidyltransferase